ncbi:cysteine-rich receptor-like protein kinase 8 [Silene latifolia]|uniref:cysteine-rich receptor-like protein kinase 8 n=1 Tax=Silene latifolia TaxID=37657 RepID=UPI003D7857FB
MDESPLMTVWNYRNIIGDQTRYLDAVKNMITNELAVRAAEGGSFQKFATEFINYSAIQPIYGLAQCTPNLNAYDCYAFLANQDFTADSLQYDLGTLLNATSNFSDENKLGEGGFGGVYKGTLSNGKLIAVKRLSANSRQGIQEFKTEVLVVAKLQHRNLVRLLGFCYTEREKLLVYEYLPNKSLDNFIFVQENRQLLDWERRYNIIRGIARGLLYLHHDSQLRIIHRDLKASNILLDDKMNPKISDFGTSRIFGVDHSQSNYTNAVVGT